MTPVELRMVLTRLKLEQHVVAQHLGIQRSSVQRWLSGDHAVPERVGRWLDRMSDLARAGKAGEVQALYDALPEGWQESGINERDKQRGELARH